MRSSESALNLSITEIDQRLQGFYASVRKSDGEDFNSSSMSNLRYSLARWQQTTRGFDIIKDPEFSNSTSVYKAKIIDLKKKGKGSVKHVDTISEEDMQKLADLKYHTPVLLQYKTWLTIQMHFAKRGRENISEMKKNDITIKEENGFRRVYLKDSLTKNHRGQDFCQSTNALIMETKNVDCPVKIITTYLSHLHPKNEFLWQRPLSQYRDDEPIWFCNQKIGVNTVGQMMPNISSLLGLSKRYTNHSIRATAITILGQSYQDTEIQAVSGHKSLNCLGIYKRTSTTVLENMSNTLHEQLHKRANTTDSVAENVIPIEASYSTQNSIADYNSVQQPLNDNDGFADLDFSAIDKLCASHDNRTVSVFKPTFNNCSNITFQIHFNK
jgi:hypothetical protein